MKVSSAAIHCDRPLRAVAVGIICLTGALVSAPVAAAAPPAVADGQRSGWVTSGPYRTYPICENTRILAQHNGYSTLGCTSPDGGQLGTWFFQYHA